MVCRRRPSDLSSSISVMADDGFTSPQSAFCREMVHHRGLSPIRRLSSGSGLAAVPAARRMAVSTIFCPRFCPRFRLAFIGEFYLIYRGRLKRGKCPGPAGPQTRDEPSGCNTMYYTVMSAVRCNTVSGRKGEKCSENTAVSLTFVFGAMLAQAAPRYDARLAVPRIF